MYHCNGYQYNIIINDCILSFNRKNLTLNIYSIAIVVKVTKHQDHITVDLVEGNH